MSEDTLERMFRECGVSVQFTDVEIGKHGQPVIRQPPTCPHCKQVVREGRDWYSRAAACVRDEWFTPDYLRSQPKDTDNG